MIPLTTSEGRRAWAVIALAGGGMAMTVYAAFALWLVATVPEYVLALGLAAHVAVFVSITGFAALLVKRTLKASVAGNSFEASDQGDAIKDGETVTISKDTP